MALTSAERVRLAIQDLPRIADDIYSGDGLGKTYPLPHFNITSGSAFLVNPNGRSWSGVPGATFTSGYVQFPGAGGIADGTPFRVRYTHTTFSDDEIGDFMERGNDVIGAQVLAIETLLFDSVKRVSWRSSDGAAYDDTAAQTLLATMHDQYLQQRREGSLGAGGIISW